MPNFILISLKIKLYRIDRAGLLRKIQKLSECDKLLKKFHDVSLLYSVEQTISSETQAIEFTFEALDLDTGISSRFSNRGNVGMNQLITCINK